MRHSGGCTARSITNWRGNIQIVDTHESSEATISIDFAADHAEIHRTLLIRGHFSDTAAAPRTAPRSGTELDTAARLQSRHTLAPMG
jgi:hypothetical protein